MIRQQPGREAAVIVSSPDESTRACTTLLVTSSLTIRARSSQEMPSGVPAGHERAQRRTRAGAPEPPASFSTRGQVACSVPDSATRLSLCDDHRLSPLGVMALSERRAKPTLIHTWTTPDNTVNLFVLLTDQGRRSDMRSP